MEPYLVQCIGRRRLELTKDDAGYAITIMQGSRVIATLRLTPAEFCNLRDATLNLLR